MVEFDHPKFVNLAKRAFRDHWELDSLIKVKTLADVENEGINKRTLALYNIPSHMKA